MSKANFYRKFKAITGTSPNEYMKTYRLNRAAAMIAEGARINEAADAVGFDSSSYFAKCFKAKFGVLPNDYLKK
jgi:AraC-like DNA-binding protein